ncbi:MAG: pirin family protein [Parvibaculum sp.]|nr:pirin family protein [Parvibaculum sp.]
MIDHLITERSRDLGGGFVVGRVLPFAQRRMVGPFIFFDHMGPVDFPAGIPKSLDVRPHPHIGLSTVTYLLSGEIMHRDSVGSELAIRPGEVNWMTAGSGITHSERLEKARAKGDLIHGIQAWVALPDGQEEVDPAFAHYGAGDLPMITDKGLSMRLIAGRAFGKQSVKTHSPMFYAHAEITAGTTLELPSDYSERAAYVVTGAVDTEGQTIASGSMAVFSSGGVAPVLTARENSTVMILGGEPVGQRFIDWNFVSSSKERIEQAKADYVSGRLKLPDIDNQEFTPLPEPRA